ncbi:hypothetical protein Y1Q_0015028 [Alligator mississippiensis]|uniref:Uncharacterized protein n=1 Tax=Alligator mississippiensis TaxID=8496 RepID=A0A151N9U4_ALLMI|nr:hypothetical protein Y1Q_0015028 [Alligator mississippiensis]
MAMASCTSGLQFQDICSSSDKPKESLGNHCHTGDVLLQVPGVEDKEGQYNCCYFITAHPQMPTPSCDKKLSRYS